jgi:ABC-type transport system involved in cytochrome bd biosynthesis fused ATPase/permease subunit
MADTIDNNIIFKRNINKKDLDKVKRVCLIYGNNILDNNVNTSLKEKIILARYLLLDNKIVIINNLFRNLSSKEEKIILKNIMTEYNKTIIFISKRKDNSYLFDNLVRLRGGKCEKVRYL